MIGSNLHRLAALTLVTLLGGSCASVCTTGACNTQTIQIYAKRHDFSFAQIEGQGYAHDVYWRGSKPQAALWIFIEGDGEPWSGMAPTDDPTPRNPLALQLAAQTRGAVAYIGRPCYLSARLDPRCSPQAWTYDRYSESIVASMNAVANELAARLQTSGFVLVGHSGGGALAVLMARGLDGVRGVVTVTGNLDVTAWTNHHRYAPLVGSLDPADAPLLATSMTEIHLIGGNDRVVPPQVSARYLGRLPPERVWRYDRFDHTCCWVMEWPSILRRLRADPALASR